MEQKEILKSMLEKVADEYDKTDGGLFFDNLSPVSFALEEAYKVIQEKFNNTFADTAVGEYLDLIVKETGLERRKATKSIGVVIFKGKSGTFIPKGTKLKSDSYFFETIEEGTIKSNGTIEIKISSIEKGSVYNLPQKSINELVLIIPGVESIENKELKDGFDEETDSELRERYFIKVREPITSGNIFHYKKWALEVEGVGAVKVFPLWNGNGTVKLVILNKDKGIADSQLLQRVKNYIDEVRPIGATVTVESAVVKNIDINVKLNVNNIIEESAVKLQVNKAVEEYLNRSSFNTKDLSYARIGSIFLSVDGINDYNNYTLNGGITNVVIAENEILKLRNLNITVIKV